MIIGVGNPDRGDDAAGRVAARRLRERGVEAIEHDGEAARLLEAWEGADEVILIDAVRAGGPPGTVHRFDATEGVPAGLGGTSTHAFGPAQAVELARALDRLPRRLVVVGIEAAQFEIGAGLSPAVDAAVEAVVEELCTKCR